MTSKDSWIAATALTLQVPVVTQGDNYVDVPNLAIIKVGAAAYSPAALS